MIVMFTVYIFSRIFKKRELSENIYNAKISTFTIINNSLGLGPHLRFPFRFLIF